MSQSKEPVPLDDAALDEYLRGQSSVSRQYQALPDDMPPPALDQQVLAQARAALEHTVQPAVRRPRWVRWAPPLAVAASAVLALSIIMQGGLQQAELAQPAAMQEVAPSARVIQEQADVAMEAAVAVQGDSLPAVVNDLDAVNPPPPPEVQLPPPAAPGIATEKAAAGRAADQAREVRPLQNRAQPQPQPQPQPQLQSAEVAQDATPAAAQRAEMARMRVNESVQRAAPAAAPAVPPAAPPPPAVATMAVQPPAPETWLSEIRRLRLDGEVEEADRQWQYFRAAFPDYAVTDADPARPAGCRGGC